MQLQEVLEKRRSVRKYLRKPVEEDKVKKILQAAILAPSWNNTQVSRYYVISGEETLQKVKAALAESNQHNVSEAPMLIVSTIIANKSGFNADGTAINELGNG